MFVGPASVLLSAAGVVAGILEALRQSLFLRRRKAALVTLILAPLLLLLILATEWYIHAALGVVDEQRVFVATLPCD